MNINCKTVPNEEIKLRRGFTGADWWWEEHLTTESKMVGEYDLVLQVRIAAELTDWRERAALALHEISEAFMCKFLGITVEQVDAFDAEYQRTHEIDLNSGDEPDCPYAIPHTFATAIERIFAGCVKLPWKPYDDRLSKI